jgi:Ca2+-transporting ATPase
VSGRQQLILFWLSLLLIVLSSELGFLQRILGTTSLTGGQWLVCLGFAVALLLLDEVIKVFLRARAPNVVEAARPVAGNGPSLDVAATVAR